jgi:hypothetical protein
VPFGTPFKQNAHNLLTKTYRDGKVVSQRQFVTGDLTIEEKVLATETGTKPAWRIGDTENRAVRALDLQKGDLAIFQGEIAPCEACQAAMREKSLATGAEIQYRYLTANGKVRVWSAQQNGYIFAEY